MLAEIQPVFQRSDEMLNKNETETILHFVKQQEYKQINRNLICWWGVSPIGLEKPIESSPLLKDLRDRIAPSSNSVCILKYAQGLRGCDRVDEGNQKTTQITLIDYDKNLYEEPPTIQMVWDGKALKVLNHGEITLLSPNIYYGFLNHHNHYEIQFKQVEFNLHQQKLELHRRIHSLSAEQVAKLLEVTNQFRL